MKSEILEKLRYELSVLPIDTEPRAMYLLVQIRKMMDHLNDETNPLRFYCNWVVHVVLNQAAAREKMDTLNKMSDGQIAKFINLRELQKHLATFLTEHNLNDDLATTEKYWTSFQEQLVGILIDTPIENPTGGLSFFALQKRNESPVGGTERVEYRMIRNGKEILGNIYPY
jgi:hypothetical protein